MDAFIEVLLDSGYSGLIVCWLYFIAGTSEELLTSILQRQLPSGHLVALA